MLPYVPAGQLLTHFFVLVRNLVELRVDKLGASAQLALFGVSERDAPRRYSVSVTRLCILVECGATDTLAAFEEKGSGERVRLASEAQRGG